MQWRYLIEQIWLHQQAPTPEEVNAWLDRAWECARHKGIYVSDPPDLAQDVSRVVNPQSGCEPWNEDG
jgi:hypothetical protein